MARRPGLDELDVLPFRTEGRILKAMGRKVTRKKRDSKKAEYSYHVPLPDGDGGFLATLA